MLNGIFWALCSGAKWRDLPERYGPWSTVYARFRQWRDDGTFEAVLSRLQLRLREDGLMDLETWMIDSTAVRATRASAGGGKKGLFDVSCGFGFIQHAPHGAADQVDHRNEIAFVSVAASARSGSLKEAIHAFQTCVRQA